MYLNLTSLPVDDAVVADIFTQMMKAIATKQRPIYFHTSDEKLQKIYHYLADNYVEKGTIKKKPTVFPDT